MRKRPLPLLAEEPPAPGAPAWMSTWATLALALLAFFVMLYAAGGMPLSDGGTDAGDEPAARGTRIAGLGSIQSRIEAELKKSGSEGMVRFESAGGALVIRMEAGALFESGRADFRSRTIAALDAVGSVLAAVGNSLRVEGHSDSDPMIPTVQYPDNWALSSARATGVLRYLRDYHRIPMDRMSVAAYAETRPVASNDTAAGKAKNRRVDIVVFGR